MNTISIYTLKALRKLYAKLFDIPVLPKLDCEQDPDMVSKIIYDKLMDDKPCMITRFGSTELITIVNYLGVKYPNKNIFKYIKGEGLPWWWEKKRLNQMQQWSGFFPPTQEKISQFCELMIEDMKEIDILGSWLEEEHYFLEKMNNIIMVHRETQNPFFAKKNWSEALKNKKVLVVHPFSKEINQQYQKRKLLFENPNILPDFELLTIQAVQSLAGEISGFKDWFEALKWMKDEIDKMDYDVCLIGAGAYGFPLAAHVKRMGKKSVHLGGSLQLLFAIRGKRWEDPNYNVKYNYSALMNEYWIRPGENARPKNAASIEGACYW